MPQKIKIKLIHKILMIAFGFSIVLNGCYPDTQVSIIKHDQLKNYRKINSSSKVVLIDGSVILMNDGFSINDNILKGNGDRYLLNGKIYNPTKTSKDIYIIALKDTVITGLIDHSTIDSVFVSTERGITRISRKNITGYTVVGDSTRNIRVHSIPLDSVSAITYYAKSSSGAKIAGDVIMGLFAPMMVYCAVCPKCCFGSCPTIYTFDGTKYNLEAELFSHCISRQLEDNDLDVLAEKIPEDGKYQLKLTNEALETHYINQLSLINVSHPLGTEIYPSSTGQIIAVQSLNSPAFVTNCEALNITSYINRQDGYYYRSDSLMVRKLKDHAFKDNLSFNMKAPEGCRNAKIVLRYRNTLMSTILFYDMVLGSQGVKAIDWLEKMNNDPIYAAQFKTVYKYFSGITIKTSDNNKEWIETGNFTDAGPINWKYAAAVVPINSAGILNVKLEFFPDNFMIDYIGIDFSGNIPYTLIPLKPVDIKDNLENNRIDILDLIENIDSKYLETNPGESFSFTFDIPRCNIVKNTLMLSSKGYYTEWLRGKWITEMESPFEFSLYNIGGTIKELAYRWLEDRKIMETEFFRNKIPIKKVN